jgi:hypothetical protein
MKSFLIVPAFCTVALAAPAMSQEQIWLRQFGTSASDGASALAPSPGGVFIAGYTRGSLAAPLTGTTNAFLAHYDFAGNQGWVRQFGSGDSTIARAALATGDGGAIIAGSTSGYLASPSAGGADVWLAKYDAQGNRIWIRQFGGAGNEMGISLTTDAQGGIYLAGWTDGDLGGSHAGAYDTWVARADEQGAIGWLRQFGTEGQDVVTGMTQDGTGGIFIGGRTTGNLAAVNFGAFDAWLAHYDGSGARTWIRQFGTQYNDDVTAMAPDGRGGFYAAGQTWGDLAGTGPIATGAAWIGHFSADGTLRWMRQFGNSPTTPQSLAAAPGGGVWITGTATNSLGGPHIGNKDVWFAHYDESGDRTTIRQFGSPAADVVNAAIATSNPRSIYLCGYTSGSLASPNQGQDDAWLGRFISPCYPNCDGSTVEPILNIDDFTCFINEFAQAQSLPHAQQLTHYANCDNSTTDPVLNVDDFTCFINAFAQGCP